MRFFTLICALCMTNSKGKELFQKKNCNWQEKSNHIRAGKVRISCGSFSKLMTNVGKFEHRESCKEEKWSFFDPTWKQGFRLSCATGSNWNGGSGDNGDFKIAQYLGGLDAAFICEHSDAATWGSCQPMPCVKGENWEDFNEKAYPFKTIYPGQRTPVICDDGMMIRGKSDRMVSCEGDQAAQKSLWKFQNHTAEEYFYPECVRVSCPEVLDEDFTASDNLPHRNYVGDLETNKDGSEVGGSGKRFKVGTRVEFSCNAENGLYVQAKVRNLQIARAECILTDPYALTTKWKLLDPNDEVEDGLFPVCQQVTCMVPTVTNGYAIRRASQRTGGKKFEPGDIITHGGEVSFECEADLAAGLKRKLYSYPGFAPIDTGVCDGAGVKGEPEGRFSFVAIRLPEKAVDVVWEYDPVDARNDDYATTYSALVDNATYTVQVPNYYQ